MKEKKPRVVLRPIDAVIAPEDPEVAKQVGETVEEVLDEEQRETSQVVAVKEDQESKKLSDKAKGALFGFGISALAAAIIFAAVKGNQDKKPVASTSEPTPGIESQVPTQVPAFVFTDVNDEEQVEKVAEDAMEKLGEFATKAGITKEDIKDMIYTINAPYVANYDLIPEKVRSVDEKITSLYTMYLGFNDSRLYGNPDATKNGEHKFMISDLLVADTKKLALLQDFDTALNTMLDADKVEDVQYLASETFYRLATQVKVVNDGEPNIDDMSSENYGALYAYATINETVYPIYGACGAGFTADDVYYTSTGKDDVVKAALDDYINSRGKDLQGYIGGNCPTLN